MNLASTRPLYIFDLDGTLANAEHRMHHIAGETKNWDAFFDACGEDEPIRQAITTLHALRLAGMDVWIWTGRSDSVRDKTLAWLGRHSIVPTFHLRSGPLVDPAHVRMRPAGNHTPDVSLKAQWLAEMHPLDMARLVAVFEDRDSVVAMWRSNGVPCFQVAPGTF